MRERERAVVRCRCEASLLQQVSDSINSRWRCSDAGAFCRGLSRPSAGSRRPRRQPPRPCGRRHRARQRQRQVSCDANKRVRTNARAGAKVVVLATPQTPFRVFEQSTAPRRPEQHARSHVVWSDAVACATRTADRRMVDVEIAI